MVEIKEEMDTNEDGKISYDEAVLWMQSQQNRKDRMRGALVYIGDKLVDLLVIGVAIGITALTGIVLI